MHSPPQGQGLHSSLLESSFPITILVVLLEEWVATMPSAAATHAVCWSCIVLTWEGNPNGEVNDQQSPNQNPWSWKLSLMLNPITYAQRSIWTHPLASPMMSGIPGDPCVQQGCDTRTETPKHQVAVGSRRGCMGEVFWPPQMKGALPTSPCKGPWQQPLLGWSPHWGKRPWGARGLQYRAEGEECLHWAADRSVPGNDAEPPPPRAIRKGCLGCSSAGDAQGQRDCLHPWRLDPTWSRGAWSWARGWGKEKKGAWRKFSLQCLELPRWLAHILISSLQKVDLH